MKYITEITDLTQYVYTPTNIPAHFEICYQMRTKTWWTYMNQDFESTINILRYLVLLERTSRVKDKKTGHVVSIASIKELNLFYIGISDRYGVKTDWDA